jgi:pimeloyl-ACP methyl ester carboxylesterase
MGSGMKFRVGGGEIAYDVAGNGPALLLLHAFPLSRRMWEPQLGIASVQTVRFDVRGLGDSPPSEGIVTMERIADDAAGLLDHLGISRAVVCGLSMGGYAALAFARRHADRMRGLVLSDTRASADTPEARAARAELGRRIRTGGAAVAADAMLDKLLGPTTRARRPELVRQLRELIEANAPSGICDALAGIAARDDSTRFLRDIGVPTLVVVGEEDELTPPSDAEALRDGIPGAELAVVPGAGHVANLENPEAWNAALRGFLEGLKL